MKVNFKTEANVLKSLRQVKLQDDLDPDTVVHMNWLLQQISGALIRHRSEGLSLVDTLIITIGHFLKESYVSRFPKTKPNEPNPEPPIELYLPYYRQAEAWALQLYNDLNLEDDAEQRARDIQNIKDSIRFSTNILRRVHASPPSRALLTKC
jgi:hypothetical protein